MATVTLHNPSSALAFAVHLKVNRASDLRVSREGQRDEELPVLWPDNYFALLPGATRQVTATFRIPGNDSAMPSLVIEGWNVKQKIAEGQQ